MALPNCHHLSTLSPFSLPSSLHLKGNTVFSMQKSPGAVNRTNPPGPVENVPRVAATVSMKGERSKKRRVDA